MRRAGALLLIVACHATEPPPSHTSPLVVQPKAVDAGALVTVPSPPAPNDAPIGCPPSEEMNEEANRLAAALRQRTHAEWMAELQSDSLRAWHKGELPSSPAMRERIYESVIAAIPDIVLGKEDDDAPRGHCKQIVFEPGVDIRSIYRVCITGGSSLVHDVRIMRSPKLGVYRSLLEHGEREVTAVALVHAQRTMKHPPSPDEIARPLLWLGCDEDGRVTSAIWRFWGAWEGGPYNIHVDARTGRIVDPEKK